ncbi:hypothetical protein SRHO_G00308740 [Serrasalmus rhombeus]
MFSHSHCTKTDAVRLVLADNASKANQSVWTVIKVSVRSSGDVGGAEGVCGEEQGGVWSVGEREGRGSCEQEFREDFRVKILRSNSAEGRRDCWNRRTLNPCCGRAVPTSSWLEPGVSLVNVFGFSAIGSSMAMLKLPADLVPPEIPEGVIYQVLDAVKVFGCIKISEHRLGQDRKSQFILVETTADILLISVSEQIGDRDEWGPWVVIVVEPTPTQASVKTEDFHVKLAAFLEHEGKTLADLGGLTSPLSSTAAPPSLNTELVNAISSLVDKCSVTTMENQNYRKLRLCSGRKPTPHGEEEYEAWAERTTHMLEEWQCSDTMKKQRIAEGLQGPAADIVRFLRVSNPNAMAVDYLKALESAFGTTENADDLLEKFRSTFQEENEKLSAYLFSNGSLHKSYKRYVKDMRRELQIAYQLAESKAGRKNDANKRLYDQRVRYFHLAPGDRVLIRNLGLPGKHKLADCWASTPYIVESQMPGLPVFRLRPQSGEGPTKILHRNHLLPIGEVRFRDDPEIVPLQAPLRRSQRKKTREGSRTLPEEPSSQEMMDEQGDESDSGDDSDFGYDFHIPAPMTVDGGALQERHEFVPSLDLGISGQTENLVEDLPLPEVRHREVIQPAVVVEPETRVGETESQPEQLGRGTERLLEPPDAEPVLWTAVPTSSWLEPGVSLVNVFGFSAIGSSMAMLKLPADL